MLLRLDHDFLNIGLIDNGIANPDATGSFSICGARNQPRAMRIRRYLPLSSSRLQARAARRGKRMLHLTGTISCLLAIFISAGAHWAVLQSFAYTKMLVEFAERDSWGTAVKKAFDERYACSLCPENPQRL